MCLPGRVSGSNQPFAPFRGRFGLKPALGPTPTPSLRQTALCREQINWSQRQRQTIYVLGWAPSAHLGATEHPLHLQGRAPHFRHHRHLAPLRRNFLPTWVKLAASIGFHSRLLASTRRLRFSFRLELCRDYKYDKATPAGETTHEPTGTPDRGQQRMEDIRR